MADDEMIEVSRSKLSAVEGSAKLMDALWNDPKIGMRVKEFTKEKFPNAVIPELDAIQEVKKTETELRAEMAAKEKSIDDKISAWEKKQNDRDAKDADEKATAKFEQEVQSVTRKYKLTQEGVEKVFARMKEKNNPDFEAAAAYVTDHEQAARPIEQPGYGSQSMDFQNSFSSAQEDKDWELLNKNPWDMKFADKEIRQISADFANGRGHLYGPNGMGGEY